MWGGGEVMKQRKKQNQKYNVNPIDNSWGNITVVFVGIAFIYGSVRCWKRCPLTNNSCNCSPRQCRISVTSLQKQMRPESKQRNFLSNKAAIITMTVENNRGHATECNIWKMKGPTTAMYLRNKIIQQQQLKPVTSIFITQWGNGICRANAVKKENNFLWNWK